MTHPIQKFLLAATSVALAGTASAQSVQNIVLFADGAGGVGGGGPALNTRRVEFVDLDNDGDADLFAANHGANCTLYINDGTGSFAQDLDGNDNNELDDVSATVKGVAFGDWDGDGDLDCALGLGPDGGLQQANRFFRNDSTGADDPVFTEVFPAGPAVDLDHSYDLAFIDVDGGAVAAGDLLLVVANRKLNGQVLTGVNRVYRSNGVNGWMKQAASPVSAASRPDSTRALLVGDLDGDGLDDLITLNAGAGGQLNEAFRNDGLGGLVEDEVPGFGSAPGNSYGGALGDLDGDGDLDLVVANRLSAQAGAANFVFRNDSTVGDIVMTRITGGALDGSVATSYDVGIADLDQDGDQDVVVANNLQANAVYMSNAADDGLAPGDVLGGSYADAFTKLTHGAIQADTGRTRSVAIADIADYGPNANHQGPEVALANADLAGGETNFFFRSYGSMFADLGGANTGNFTARLSGAGFLAPSTDASLLLSEAQPNSLYQLFGSLTTTATPFAGGTLFVLGGPVLLTSGGTGPTGEALIDIPAGSLPATAEGVFIVFQYATQDNGLAPDLAISNGLSAMIQGDS